MKFHSRWATSLVLLSCVFSNAEASHISGDKLHVPGDFPGTFSMQLLGGGVIFDGLPGATTPTGEVWNNGTEPIAMGILPISTQNRTIDFQASAFNNIGPGAGTSTLTFPAVDYWGIGTGTDSFYSLGGPISSGNPIIYASGWGWGALSDNGNGTGEWSLVLPLYLFWNNQNISLGNVNFNTSATYTFMIPAIYTGTGVSELGSMSGRSLDYHTGDTLLVAQTVVMNDPWMGSGIRLTIGLAGNDPPATVPIPGAVWLFGSGLLGLIGAARRKAA